MPAYGLDPVLEGGKYRLALCVGCEVVLTGCNGALYKYLVKKGNT